MRGGAARDGARDVRRVETRAGVVPFRALRDDGTQRAGVARLRATDKEGDGMTEGKKLTRPMMNREAVAVEVMRCALSHEPNACLLGNVMASEIAALAASAIDSCPKCGAVAWVNIDCDVCMIVGQLMGGEIP
jgi:hypothetical protein